MKRRYILSFFIGVLSAVVALGYAFITLYSAIRLKQVAETISDTTDELAGINLLAFAGLSYLVAILLMIICFSLAGYRGTLSYFYLKIAFSDEKFFKERKNSTVAFSVLALITFGIYLTAFYVFEGVTDGKVKGVLTAFTIAYALLGTVPLIEREIQRISRRPLKTEVVSAEKFDKDKILKELDDLADETAGKESPARETPEEEKTVEEKTVEEKPAEQSLKEGEETPPGSTDKEVKNGEETAE